MSATSVSRLPRIIQDECESRGLTLVMENHKKHVHIIVGGKFVGVFPHGAVGSSEAHRRRALLIRANIRKTFGPG